VESDERKTPIAIQLNSSLPTMFIDNLNITTRADGLHLIRLLSGLPEGLKEESRIMVPSQALRNMLDVMCAHVGYYPEKASREKAPARK
jgi:hypothetical protein